IFLEFPVGFVLELEAAHEPTAGPGYLCRVEAQVLFLSHLNGDGMEILQKCRTAQRPPTAPKAAHHFCLVANSDLAQFDTGPQPSDQVFEKFSKIYPAVCSKVEYDLAAVEEVFHVHKVHREFVGGNFLQAKTLRLRLDFHVAMKLADFIFRRHPFDLLYIPGMDSGVLRARRLDYLPKPGPLFGV